MIFLIQTINEKIKHDFSFHLIRAIEYLNEWKNVGIGYILTEHTSNYSINTIPVGSVEFVSECIKNGYNINLKPKNVPEILFPFAGRKIKNSNKIEYLTEYRDNIFIKSNNIIKCNFNGIYDKNLDIFDENFTNVQISDLINIVSEYRCFVFNNKLIGCKNYCGDYTMLPKFEVINKMINVYKNQAPASYTLDVGITDNNKTCVIEVHDFFSCGLYGFDNYDKLPYMFSQWFYELVNKKK